MERMNWLFALIVAVMMLSCRSQPDSDRNYDSFNPRKVYALQLNPLPGSAYRYEIINETETSAEVNDKTAESTSKTEIGMQYKIGRDSMNNIMLIITYDMLRLHSKAGDNETNLDADNSTGSFDPGERMLGTLKNATITAVLDGAGNVQAIQGYQELGNKIVENFDPNDATGRAAAQALWEKKIGAGLIKNNIEQLFKVFPDSMIHLNDQWSTASKQEGEINYVARNTYTLEDIKDDIAVISFKGTIASTNATVGSGIGLNSVTTDLKGKQEGEFEMEIQTGMVLKGNVNSTMKGTIKTMGRDIPTTIKTSVTIQGKRL